MNAARNKKPIRSKSSPIIKPLACAFGMNEAIMSSSGSDNEPPINARHKSLVHIDVPRRFKESLTFSDDNDSILKLRKPKRRRGKNARKKQASTSSTIQTAALSPTSAGSIVNKKRSCYRFPLQKGLSKKFPSLQSMAKESRDDDDFVNSSSDSSSCLTESSGDIQGPSRDASVESNIDERDKYEVEEVVPPLTVEWHHSVDDEQVEGFPTSETIQVQDCFEEQDTLILQLHIPVPPQPLMESLDVEYLPFKVPVLQTDTA